MWVLHFVVVDKIVSELKDLEHYWQVLVFHHKYESSFFCQVNKHTEMWCLCENKNRSVDFIIVRVDNLILPEPRSLLGMFRKSRAGSPWFLYKSCVDRVFSITNATNIPWLHLKHIQHTNIEFSTEVVHSGSFTTIGESKFSSILRMVQNNANKKV